MAKTRVLLVDDEVDFTDVLKTRLEARDLDVTTAADGAAALAAVGAKSFDAIILDMVMPGMDGLEVLRKILASDPAAQVVLLTGHGTVEKGVAAVRDGAADFLEKPAAIEELMSRIDEASQKRTTLLKERSAQKIDEILKSKGW